MTSTQHSTISARPPAACIGMDLAKHSIHVYGVDAQGRPCVDRKMRPGQVKEFLSGLAPCMIGLEACGRAHQWGRDIQALGHEARLMAPQFVKPYVKSNKNDRADAQAICEALQRP